MTLFLSRILSWWKVKEKKPSIPPEVVVATSYGSVESRLMVCTEACFGLAISISNSLDGIHIAFSNSDRSGSPHISDFEFAHKIGLMNKNSLLGNPISMIFARPFRGAIEEMLMVGNAVSLWIPDLRSIVVVTGELISPLTYKVYSRLFPRAEVTIVTVPHEAEVQVDSPYFFRRGLVRWFVGNIVMRLALEFFSMRLVATFFRDMF